MDHDGLRSPCNHIETVGHRDGDIFMRNHKGLRQPNAETLCFCVRLDQRWKISPRICEEIVDTPARQKPEIGLCNAWPNSVSGCIERRRVKIAHSSARFLCVLDFNECVG